MLFTILFTACRSDSELDSGDDIGNTLTTTDELEVMQEFDLESEPNGYESLEINMDDFVRIDSLSSLSELDDVVYINPVEVDIGRLGDIHEWIYDLRQEYSTQLAELQKTLFGEESLEQNNFEFVTTNRIVFYRLRYVVDGVEVIGHISAPADHLTGNYPILIWNRGGNGSYGKNEGSEVWLMAQHGFIVLATQYRGVDGGMDFDRFGGADVYDVTKLIDFAEMFTFSSGEIFMYGWSRGAMQTFIVLSRDDRIDAAVAGAGMSNLIDTYREREDMQQMLRMRVGGPPYAVPEEFEARSAICWPEKINTPLLIVHGTADERVGYHHSKMLYEAMYVLEKDVSLVLFQDMDHYAPAWAFKTEYLLWLRMHSHY